MSRTFQDENFLVWEVYPSGSRFGLSQRPELVFHCLTDRQLAPRFLEHGEHEAAAERTIVEASPADLLALLRQSRETG